MPELLENVIQYSKFLDDILKNEEAKVKRGAKCSCGCGATNCTCTLDAYKKVAKKYYQLFPEYEKEVIQ